MRDLRALSPQLAHLSTGASGLLVFLLNARPGLVPGAKHTNGPRQLNQSPNSIAAAGSMQTHMPKGIRAVADNTNPSPDASPHEGEPFTLDVHSHGHRLRVSAPRWSERLALVSIVLFGVIALVYVLVVAGVLS